MTETLTRGATNQAGAVVNPNAAAEAQDFLPLKGIDYVEFWVGNAKQAAAYYRALWGFTPVAYAGLKHGDGVHDIAFAVDDATSAWEETTKRGARSALEPIEHKGEKGTLRKSAI